MELLYILEDLRNPVLDALMLLVTRLGEETPFLVAAMIVFWCVDKRRGYYLLTVGFLGTLLNQFVKLLCRVPRPWVVDPNFTILEQAREAAAGFSFPSGHSTSAVGAYGAIAATVKNRWVRAVCIAVCVLVPFSRMYIGVHTPADVLVGSAMALVLVWVLRPLAFGASDRVVLGCFGAAFALGVGLMVFTANYPFAVEASQLHNLESGAKNAYTMMGAAAGLLIGFSLEKKYVKFETKAVWWVQILKVVLGFVLVIAVKEGLRAPLEALFAGHLAARAVRYCLIVLAAGVVWPMTFRWFSKIGARK